MHEVEDNLPDDPAAYVPDEVDVHDLLTDCYEFVQLVLSKRNAKHVDEAARALIPLLEECLTWNRVH